MDSMAAKLADSQPEAHFDSIQATVLPRGICELDELLKYRNQDVIDSFCASLDIPPDEADKIFREYLKFAWVSEISSERVVAVIDGPILIIDEMWHTFVLYTKEYAEFCMKYFGRFIHHCPETESNKRLLREKWTNKDDWRRHVIAEKRRRYDCIYELLGRETFVEWFFNFPNKYSAEKIKGLRRK